jgi:hypothetical protein
MQPWLTALALIAVPSALVFAVVAIVAIRPRSAPAVVKVLKALTGLLRALVPWGSGPAFSAAVLGRRDGQPALPSAWPRSRDDDAAGRPAGEARTGAA